MSVFFLMLMAMSHLVLGARLWQVGIKDDSPADFVLGMVAVVAAIALVFAAAPS